MRFTRLVAAAATAVLAGTVAATPTWGAEARPASDAEVQAIIEQAWRTGEVTPTQRARVLTRPDIAENTIDPTSVKADYELPGYVPDPDEVTTPPKPPAGARTAASTMATAAINTTSKDRYIVYDTWAGTVQLRYHFVVAWSYDGYQVKGTPSAYTYIRDCSGTCSNYGITKNSQYPNYKDGRLYAWTVPLNAKHTYCKAGTCQTFYPAVRFGVYYNGTYGYVFLNE